MGGLHKNVTKVVKKSLTRTATEYALSQCCTFTVSCDDGHLNISNVLTENAIRPFAIGRKVGLFAHITRGTNASSTCYSPIETAMANNFGPCAYIHIFLTISAAPIRLRKFRHYYPGMYLRILRRSRF